MLIDQAAGNLAKNVLELRKKLKWSQMDLAKYSEVPRSTITYIESGQGNPSLQVLVKIAQGLNVSVDELLSQPRGSTKLLKPEDFPVHKRSQGRAALVKLLPDKIQGIEIDKMIMQSGSMFGGQPHLMG